jgi:hypothetical protein
MTDEGKDKTTDSQDQTTSSDKGAEKAFTQSDLDRIVSQRVNETKAKFEGFDSFRDKAQIFDNMMEDQRFQQFVSRLESQPEDFDPSGIKGMEDLQRYDPDIASAVKSIIEDVRQQDRKLYEKEMQKAVEPFRQELDTQKVTRAVDEVERMRSNTEQFPHMQSRDFEGHMASLLTTPDPNAPIGPGNSPRAFSLEDAYDLATVHFERDGKELPKPPSHVDTAKKDAELLEDRAGGDTGTQPLDEEPPPKFKDAREAAEYAMKKLGWM